VESRVRKLVDISKKHVSYKIGVSQNVRYVAVVVGCELAVEDGSFVRLLKVEEGDCTVRDSGYDKCY